MDNQGDNFTGGFLTGALLGGVVGGIFGALLASRLPSASEEFSLENNSTTPKLGRRRKRQLRATTELNIEEARQGLEAKIAQLNEAIDEVRQQLSNVNGNEKKLRE